MSIKVFNIRLNKEHSQEDQNRMNTFLDSVNVGITSSNFVTTGTIDFWSVIVFYELKKTKLQIIDNLGLSLEEEKIYDSLKQWRNDIAKSRSWSAFRICHNSHLLSIVKKKPQSLDDFKEVRGFGDNRINIYGNDIISLLNAL